MANKIQYGIGMRTQYAAGFDMHAGFLEQLEQARLAETLGFDSLMKNSHFAGYPLQEFQQLPFLGRIMAEAPSLRLNTGVLLLPLLVELLQGLFEPLLRPLRRSGVLPLLPLGFRGVTLHVARRLVELFDDLLEAALVLIGRGTAATGCARALLLLRLLPALLLA